MEPITAERCTLRALEPSDLELLYAWENDPRVWRISGTLAPTSRERLRSFIEEQNYDIYATRQMRLVVEVDGVAIGTLDVLEFDPQHRRFGLGILIYDTSHRRMGYARSAIEAIVRYGREVLHVHQVWASVEEDNEASLALFRSCGFQESGRRKDWLLRPNGYRDCIEFQLLL